MQERGMAVVMILSLSVALCMVAEFHRGREAYLPAVGANVSMLSDSGGMEDLGGDSLASAPTRAASSEIGKDSGTEADSEENSAFEGKPSSGRESGLENAAICLGFAGDICLDETSAVMRHMEREGGLEKVISPELIRKMNGYDAMVINNEFSVSRRGKKMAGKAYTFRSHPSNLRYLKQLGVDVAGLANNHVYDYGKTAFLDTLHHLKDAGFQTVGAGADIREAKRPAYLKIKGKTIAIVAATRAEKYVLTPGAGKDSPGVFRTYEDGRYVREIRNAKKKADYVIAYVHWGTEYSTALEDAQREQARDYINAGADAVVGAHTHCMQGIGYYKGVPIFYSLGNFWFNEKTLYTTVLELGIDSGGKLEAKMVPCLQRGKETKILQRRDQIRKFIKYINGISENGRLDRHCNVVERQAH